MEVILLEKIANLGALGDRVTVKAGYGRNYLIPQAEAVAATADNIEAFEARRAELEKEAAQILSAAEARATAVAALELTISANAGEEGKLFGSVGARDIAQAAADAGVELDRLARRRLRGLAELQLRREAAAAVRAPGDHTSAKERSGGPLAAHKAAHSPATRGPAKIR